MKESTIAIIGGGFCGTLVAHRLISKTPQEYPLKILLIEKSAHLARGVAYGTTDPSHLLNVPASRMGAFPEEPEQFLAWLKANETLWRQLDPSFANIQVTPDSFLPRMIYALYLEDVFQNVRRLAQEKGITFTIIQQEAIDLDKHDDGLEISLNDHSKICADKVILATGLPSSKKMEFSFQSSDLYLPNFWSAKEKMIQLLRQKKHLVIIGSGLTMVDVVLTLRHLDYKGEIVAISKGGKLPERHLEHLKTYPQTYNSELFPNTLVQVLKMFRKEIVQAVQEGYDWRNVLDAWKPWTPLIWKSLSISERKKFLAKLFSLWNRHRHRIAPSCYESLSLQQSRGKLKIITGKVDQIEMADSQKFKVHYYRKDFNGIIETEGVINCSGPELNIVKNSNLLIRNILDKGYLKTNALQAGIQTDEVGNAAGHALDSLFVLGQFLFGEKFEAMAVPELRLQCQQLADYLLNRLLR